MSNRIIAAIECRIITGDNCLKNAINRLNDIILYAADYNLTIANHVVKEGKISHNKDDYYIIYVSDKGTLNLGKWHIETLKGNCKVSNYDPDDVICYTKDAINKLIFKYVASIQYIDISNVVTNVHKITKNKENEDRLHEPKVPSGGRENYTGVAIAIARVRPKVEIGQVKNGTAISC